MKDKKNLLNNVIKWAHIIGFQIFILIIIMGIRGRSKYNLHIDMPSPYTIVADRDFLIEDEEATKRKIEEARSKVNFVYDYSPYWNINIQEKFKGAFIKLKERTENLNTSYIKNFFKNEGIEIDERDVDYLVKSNFSTSILRNVESISLWTKNLYIVSEKNLFLKHLEKGISIRILKSDGTIESEIQLEDMTNIMDVEEVKKNISLRIKSPGLKNLVEKLIVPNLYFNESETLKRKVEAERSVKPVFHSIKKGEVLVRTGDRVTEEIWKKIKVFKAIKGKSHEWKFYLGSSLLNLFIFFIIFYYLPSKIKEYNLSIKDISFLSLIILLSVGITKLLLVVGDAISLKYGWEIGISFPFLLPIPMAPMIAFSFLGSIHAFLIFITMITIEAALLKIHIYAVLFHLLYGLTLIFFLRSKRMKIAVAKAGLKSILWSMFFATGIGLIAGSGELINLLKFNFYGISCGILSGILSAGIIPLAEIIFGYTSELKLLELSYREHPLLKQMVLNASGTFQHSLMVSDLAEEAAEAIKANSTIAKIGGLYHDIGKITKPEFFIENQKPGNNPHDHLSPKMSALIVVSHVKEGKELALKHKLPREIIEIIETHHGTSVVQYFYDKAKKIWDPEKSELSAEDFRYPGPKPKTKEECIVMMADRVEAAVRVLDPITPQKIEGAVEEIFKKLFDDGQLDKCDITTQEIALIKEVFVKKLVATYHHRIDYPSTLKRKAKVLQFGVGNAESFNKDSK